MNEVVADQIEYYGKIWLSRLSLVVAILLILPTTAILATWNTLPNEPLYPVKIYLENIALKLVGNSFSARADLQATFVEQRFNEAEVLLIQSSNEGLVGLTAQIKVAKAEIVAAKESSDSKKVAIAEKKSEKLVTQLKEYDKKLEEKKTQTINPTPSFKVNPVASPVVSSAATPIATPLATPASGAEVSEPTNADDVQQVIQETIKELEQTSAAVKIEELQSPKPSDSPKSEGSKEVKESEAETKNKSRDNEEKREDNKEIKKDDKDH